MTELTTYQGGVVAVPQQSAGVAPSTVQSLQAWAESARAAHSVATSLAGTSFVPQQFRGKPDEVTAAILAGDEVGLSPLAALRSFDIIQGTAAARAMTLRAILQSKGHEIWTVESTDARAIVQGKRFGSDKVHESSWDTGRARGLGLLGKDNWKKQPKAMLVARATAECCRLVAADAILGIPYAVEELDDGGGQEEKPRTAQRRAPAKATATVQRPAPQARPAQQRPAPPAPADGPPLPGEDDYDDEPAAEEQPAEDEDQAPELITRAQASKLHALFSQAEIGGRNDRIHISGEIVGRKLQSSSELTKQEASGLIDMLEYLAQNGDLTNDVEELLNAVALAQDEQAQMAAAEADGAG